MKKKALLSSIIVIMLCLSVIAGSTFALFTDYAELNVAVTSGKVDLTANYDTASMTGKSLDGVTKDSYADLTATNGVLTFVNGGVAKFTSDGAIDIALMTPGDEITFTLAVANDSNVKIKYRVRMYTELLENGTDGQGNTLYYGDLAPALVTTAKINDATTIALVNNGTEVATDWIEVAANTDINDIVINVQFPNTSDVIAPNDAQPGDPVYNPDNQYQDCGAKIYFVIEAVQYNGVPNATN